MWITISVSRANSIWSPERTSGLTRRRMCGATIGFPISIPISLPLGPPIEVPGLSFEAGRDPILGRAAVNF